MSVNAASAVGCENWAWNGSYGSMVCVSDLLQSWRKKRDTRTPPPSSSAMTPACTAAAHTEEQDWDKIGARLGQVWKLAHKSNSKLTWALTLTWKDAFGYLERQGDDAGHDDANLSYAYWASQDSLAQYLFFFILYNTETTSNEVTQFLHTAPHLLHV